MKRQRDNENAESLDLAISLMLLSHSHQQESESQKISSPPEFECKTCNRKFSSFQALGGHRASHKKPKPEVELEQVQKVRLHQCSICGLKFSLGQALGGHMRKHRAALNENDKENQNEGFPSINEVVAKVPVLRRSSSTRVMCLDLNLTPLENDLKLLFGNKAPQVNLSLC